MSTSWTARREEFQPDLRAVPHLSKRSLPSKRVEPLDGGGMPWSWKLGRFAGVDVYIHATFLILIGWLLMVYFSRGSTPMEAIAGIAFVLALFFCVVLHEFGHALTARRYGVRTRDITLLPIGGVARLERIPRIPYQELLVALAGPAVNVVIAAVLYLGILVSGRPYAGFDSPILGTGSNPFGDLMLINLMLAVFNMLPAFPMDGGRVLRALLALKIPRVKATRIASIMGQIMAVLFAVWGLLGNPFMLLIALFVYLGATQEYQTIRWEAAVEGLSVRNAMITNYRTLIAQDPLSRAVALLLQDSQHDFPVLDGDFRVIGMLLRQDLIAALSSEGGAQLTVEKAMRKLTASARPDEPLEVVFERMQAYQLPIMPIFDEDSRLVGLLTMENVAEVVMVKNAMEKAKADRPLGLPQPQPRENPDHFDV